MFHHHYTVLATNSTDTLQLRQQAYQLTSNDSLQQHHYYCSKQLDPVLGYFDPHHVLIANISKIHSIIYKDFYLLYVLASSHHLNSVGIPCSFHHRQMQSPSISTYITHVSAIAFINTLLPPTHMLSLGSMLLNNAVQLLRMHSADDR